MDAITATTIGSPSKEQLSRMSPKKVAQDFESLLISQMFNAMQKTVDRSGLLDGGSAEKTYREMLNQALSQEMARSGGFGLSEQVTRQLDQYKAVEKDMQAASNDAQTSLDSNL